MNVLAPLDSGSLRETVGGKAANLARLIDAAFNVPEARAITVDAFDRHVAACREAGAAGDDALRAAILSRPLDAELDAALRAFVEAAGGRVSIRSSATLEDAHTHAFAGQFLTVLNVGADGVADAVRGVWASAFTDNVRAYLKRGGLNGEALQMAVVVQQQIDSQTSGVVLGGADRAMIEAVFGQGEGVVSAEVPSDHWDLQNGRIVATHVADKGWRVGLPEGPPTGSLARFDLPADVRTQPSLSYTRVLQVATLAGRLAAAFGGRPQDCEFSFVGDTLYVLQTRDVTASLPVVAPPAGPWTPPGKGAWELDDSHFSRPVSRIFARLFPPAMERGFKKAAARYGALLSHADIAAVNGFMYMRMRPVAAPEDATTKDPPPRFVFRLLCFLVPELRRRIATSARIWESQEWRLQAAEWQEAKRDSIAAHLALQRVDLAGLDDTALLEHLNRVVAHVEAMIEQHHTYNLAAMIPTGDLLAHAERFSGGRLTPAEVLGLLAGSSAVSADLRSPDARRLAEAVGNSKQARALLRLDDASAAPGDIEAAQALEGLQALPGEVGELARAFLAEREYRLIEGLDPTAPCLRELPTVLWQAVRDACRFASEAPADADADAQLARCREAIPIEHHAAFAALLEEARFTYHLRDERALYSDVWAWGILRAVCLEIGARLHRQAEPRVVEPADALQADPDELAALLRGSGGPSAMELQERGAYQRAYTVEDAPARLGPAAKPPPPGDMLPAGAARLSDAVMTAIGVMLPPRAEASTSDGAELSGRPASAGVYEGPAHVVASPRDVENLKPGSVLVVGAGSSAFTMLAPLASAVIAEGGGLLSHVAIVCREYRIPCVCGCAGVLERVRTGDRVRVDGTHGKVTLLDR